MQKSCQTLCLRVPGGAFGCFLFFCNFSRTLVISAFTDLSPKKTRSTHEPNLFHNPGEKRKYTRKFIAREQNKVFALHFLN